METKSYLIAVNDEEGFWFVNNFEVKMENGFPVHIATGTDKREGATTWEYTMARSIAAFMMTYNPRRAVNVVTAY